MGGKLGRERENVLGGKTKWSEKTMRCFKSFPDGRLFKALLRQDASVSPHMRHTKPSELPHSLHRQHPK